MKFEQALILLRLGKKVSNLVKLKNLYLQIVNQSIVAFDDYGVLNPNYTPSEIELFSEDWFEVN